MNRMSNRIRNRIRTFFHGRNRRRPPWGTAEAGHCLTAKRWSYVKHRIKIAYKIDH